MAAVQVFCLVVAAVTVVSCQNSLTLLNGDYKVEWKHLTATKEIQFTVTAKTTGYVGLGISNFNSEMKNIDIMLGKVVGGTPSVEDRWVTAYGTPTLDSQQDVNLVSGSEANGETVLTFKRKLDTGDSAQDIKIEVGSKYYLAAAIGSSDDLQRHSSRTYSSLIELVSQPPSPTTTITTTTTSSPLTSSATVPTTSSATTAASTSASSSTSSATVPTTSSISKVMPTPSPTTSSVSSSSSLSSTKTTTTTIKLSASTRLPSSTTMSSSSTTSSEMIRPTATTTVTPTSTAKPVNMFSFQDGSVTWNVDDDTKWITFTLKVKATGWLGLGITKENKEMKNMDIAIGGVGTGNHGYIGQYRSSTFGQPVKNDMQYISLVGSNEANGETTITFKRLLNTGDSQDIVIQPDTAYYIAWAYHMTSDDMKNMQMHNRRGYSSKMVLVMSNNNSTNNSTNNNNNNNSSNNNNNNTTKGDGTLITSSVYISLVAIVIAAALNMQ